MVKIYYQHEKENQCMKLFLQSNTYMGLHLLHRLHVLGRKITIENARIQFYFCHNFVLTGWQTRILDGETSYNYQTKEICIYDNLNLGSVENFFIVP